MMTNSNDYGDFDDITLNVISSDKTVKHLLLQLKHSTNVKSITTSMLCAKKGDFSITKYFETFKKIKKKENVGYILFTNYKAQFSDGCEFQINSDRIKVKQCQTRDVQNLLNTNQTKPCVYQFEAMTQSASKTFKEFLKDFYVFTDQKNVVQVETSVNEILTDLFGYGINFVDFMRSWWKGNFILNKHDVISKVAELALKPYLQEVSDERGNEKSQLLAEAIMKFDMTIVESSDGESERKIWSKMSVDRERASRASYKYGICHKGIKDTEELSAIEKSIVLWYLNEVPLVIKFDDRGKKRIYGAIKLLGRDTKKKKILLVGDMSRKEFHGWDIFEKLYDLWKLKALFSNIIKKYQVSLQGRRSIPLEMILSSGEMINVIGTKELLEMSQKVLVIGKKEELSQWYISRSVFTLFLEVRKLTNHCNSIIDLLVILNCDERFKKSKQLKSKTVLTLEDYLQHIFDKGGDQDLTDLIIISTSNQCKSSIFDEICRKTSRKNIYLLKKIDDGCCVLLQSKGNITPLKSLSIERPNVLDDQIHQVFDGHINAICAQPGMGKSTLVTYLSINCPPNYWSVRVNLIEHNAFLTAGPSNKEITNKFMNLSKVDQITEALIGSNKVHLFLDGLDEIESDCFDVVLNYVRSIFSSGIHVWIFSRENLKSTITDRLHVFSININELNKEQQEKYINNRLGDVFGEEKVRNIAETVFSNVDVTDSQQLLGIPLQLFIITENFLNKPKLYEQLNQGIFVFTKMYKLFFDGKKMHEYKKTGLHLHEYRIGTDFVKRLEQYEILALKSCLDNHTFNKLKIQQTLLKEAETFLVNVKEKGDQFGIINSVTSDNVAIFNHQTFAEYFACVWLTKHIALLPKIRNDFFSVKLQNLRKIFDVMLAEESPLHLAIIYKNPNQFTRYVNNINIKDKANRSALHLMCSYGTEYRNKHFFPSTLGNPFIFEIIFNKEASIVQNVVKDLLSCDPFEEDNLLRWNCLDYALQCECLFMIEAILQKYGKSNRLIKLNFNLLWKMPKSNQTTCPNESMLSEITLGCLYLGYPKLLKKLSESYSVLATFIRDALLQANIFGYIANKTSQVIEIIEFLIAEGLDIDAKNPEGYTLLHLAFNFGVYEIAEFLLQRGVNVNNVADRGNTVLHSAVNNGQPNLSLIRMLILNGAHVNATDDDGTSALHLAAEIGDAGVVKLLLENGADAKIADNRGETVLHYTMYNDKLDLSLISMLISNGADANATNYNRNGGLYLPSKNVDLVKLLEVGDDELQTQIHNLWYSMDSDIHLMELLSDNCNDTAIRQKDKYGRTLLDLACEYNYKIINVLIEKGADVDFVKHVKLMLRWASCDKALEPSVITLLINKVININAVDDEGYSALHIAAERGDYNTVKILIDNGADVKAVTNKNHTVLHCALRRLSFHRDILTLFLESGTDANAVDKNGKSPLHYAIRKKWLDAVEVLLANNANFDSVQINLTQYLDIITYFGFVELVASALQNITEIKDIRVNDDSHLIFAMRNGQLEQHRLLDMTRCIREFRQTHEFCDYQQVLKYLEKKVTTSDSNGFRNDGLATTSAECATYEQISTTKSTDEPPAKRIKTGNIIM